MANKTDPDHKDVAGLFANTMGSLALAFVTSFLISKAVVLLGVSGGNAMLFNMVVFFSIIYADPVGAFREGKSLRDMGIKLVVGSCLGFAICFIVSMQGFMDSAGESSQTGEKSSLSFVWIILPMFLIVPLVFFGPLAERAMKRGETAEPVTAEDFKISAAFPLFMTVSMALNMGVIGAMWLLDLSFLLGGVILLASILICLTETWSANPEDLIDDVDNTEWRPRAESAEEAWSNLRKGIRHSFVSALFIGSVIYLSLKLALPFMGDMSLDDANPLWLIFDILSMATVMLVACLSLFALGLLVLVTGAYGLGRLKGSDPLTMAELAKQASARLLGGGMHWVRPDLPDN